MSKTVVLVDPDLIDLIPGFLNNKRKDAVTIAEAAERGDCDALRAIGHKLKGEGGSYGLDRITELGAAIEGAALSRDLAAVRRHHGELVEYLDSVEIVAE